MDRERAYEKEEEKRSKRMRKRRRTRTKNIARKRRTTGKACGKNGRERMEERREILKAKIKVECNNRDGKHGKNRS